MQKTLIFSTIVLTISCTPTKTHEASEGEIQQPSGASILGESTISTELPEFATTMNAHGTEIFFNRTTSDRSSMKIMTSSFENGKWSPARELPFSDGTILDVDPFLTADGSRLYFSSRRPKSPGGFEDDIDTWYVERTANGWTEPINPGAPLNSDSIEIFISIAKNGNAYFVSERDGTRGTMMSKFQDNQQWEPVDIMLSFRGEEVSAGNPCIASDESFIILASRAKDLTKPPNLFVSFNTKGEWGELLELGPTVNSEYADFAPGLSKDDRILYFTSERPGIVPEQEEGIRPPGDIYHVEITDLLRKLRNAIE